MALTLIKEDGSRKPDANSYASVADGDSYHEGHLYPDPWEAATADRKVRALVMATRVIDAEYQFHGFKANDGQALQWPRAECPDPDGAVAFWPPSGAIPGVLLSSGRNVSGGAFLPADAMPMALVHATCEMAREFLLTDRTAAPPGEGIKYQNVGTTQTGYDKSDTRPIISHVVQAMLVKYGALVNGRSGTVKLERV